MHFCNSWWNPIFWTHWLSIVLGRKISIRMLNNLFFFLLSTRSLKAHINLFFMNFLSLFLHFPHTSVLLASAYKLAKYIAAVCFWLTLKTLAKTPNHKVGRYLGIVYSLLLSYLQYWYTIHLYCFHFVFQFKEKNNPTFYEKHKM